MTTEMLSPLDEPGAYTCMRASSPTAELLSTDINTPPSASSASHRPDITKAIRGDAHLVRLLPIVNLAGDADELRIVLQGHPAMVDAGRHGDQTGIPRRCHEDVHLP